MTENQSLATAKTLSRRDRRRPGRPEAVSPEILALLRQPEGSMTLPDAGIEVEVPPAGNGRVATPENQIIDFLVAHRGQPFCDFCLTQQVRYADDADVVIAIRAIGAAFGFRRATIACTGCGEARVGVRAR